jgi:hypothetical protein
MRRQGELARLHIDLTKTSEAARELEKCLHALQNSHVGEANLLFELTTTNCTENRSTNPDEFKFRVL